MQKYLKWDDVLNLDAHSFVVATTQICAGGKNTFLKMTKETNVGIVQFITSVRHIYMSSRHIDTIM